MTKSWRPKGWEGYVKEQRKFADMTRSIASGFSREDFEAGADAMLEAIRKTGIDIPFGVIRVGNGERRWLLHRDKPGGKVVFIPDDGENE